MTGQVINIIGQNSTGEWYLLDNGGWVAAFLVDKRARRRAHRRRRHAASVGAPGGTAAPAAAATDSLAHAHARPTQPAPGRAAWASPNGSTWARSPRS
ncbi:MAG: hypothetical protein R2851_22160 [Caldilineaceae bacterium]